MAKTVDIGPYSAYAIAVKYGYQGTEEEWVKEQEENRKAAEAAAAAAAQSAKNAAASASGAAQSGQQAVQSIKDAQTSAEQAIETAKQDAVQASQAEAEKAANSAGQAASSAAEAAQSATNAAAEVGKVQSAGTAAVQAVQAAQNTATEAVSDAQQTATQAVSEAQATAVSAVQEAGTTQTSAVASAGTSAVADVSNAKTEALSQISAAGTAQVSAVGTAGADAVEDVNDAKTAALEAIDAANAALPSPTQSDAGKVPTVKADGSAYELAGPYAPLSAAIRPTASGNPVSITDSVEWPLLGLKVYGKSTQDGTPNPENPVPIVSAGDDGSINTTLTGKNLLDISKMQQRTTNGITFSLENGGIKINGVATANTDSPIFTFRLPAGTYVSNLNKTQFPWLVSVSYAVERKDVGTYWLDATIPFTVLDGDIGKYFYFAINKGATVNEVIYPQIEIGSTATPYEPYKSQSLTISTPAGLPGLPVDSGGNYTDESGQQWFCDEIDYVRGVYVQRVVLLEFDGSSDEQIDRAQTDVQVTPIFRLLLDTTSFVPNDINGLSNQFIAQNRLAANSELQNGNMWTKSSCFGNAIAVRADEFSSVQEFKEHLSTHSLKIMINAATPIETPIPPEELAAYRTLHTYDGATVVSTAEDVAGMEVKYLADGEKYAKALHESNDVLTTLLGT